jgi:hypothetical protein
MGVEKERAKRRQIAVQNNNAAKAVVEKIPQLREEPKAKARDTVGEKIGVSGKTAEQSPFCVRMMDALDRIGKTVNYFRERSVSRGPQRAGRVEPHG